jgi:hypothetical protein
MAGARRVRRIVAVPRRASKQGRTVVGLILAHIVALQPLHCCTAALCMRAYRKLFGLRENDFSLVQVQR